MTDLDAVEAYLAALPAGQRIALERIREQIRRLVPDALEAVSYGMPTFKRNDKAVVWYAGWKRHCSLYPLTDSFMASHAAALAPYTQTKGSVHFTPEAPLPDDLLEALVRARLADLEGGR
jgi:uncharacterized protein YdhG (YjbR/CyaY superfamily)